MLHLSRPAAARTRPAPARTSPAPARTSTGVLARLEGPRGTALGVAVAIWLVLVVRNRGVFRTPWVEDGDYAANSLLIEQAKQLSLLQGHYSRVGFNHPGPAFLYVQAAGEAFWFDLLRAVPAPFNGQVLASFALNAALLGIVAAIVHAWSRDARIALAAAAVCVALLGASTPGLASPWMPHLFIVPFLLLLVSAASVAAGRFHHLWCMGLAGGLLVNGHVAFALFVPVIVLLSLVTALARRRQPPWRTLSEHARSWLAFAVVVAVLALPLAVNLALNYPEPIRSYLDYSKESPVTHPWQASFDFAVQFVAPGGPTGLVWVLLAVIAAAAGAWRVRRLRVELAGLVGAGVVSFSLVVVYARVGVDNLSEEYVGYFARAIPVAGVVAVVVAAGASLPRTRAATLAAGAAALVLLLPLASGPEIVNPVTGDPAVDTLTDELLSERPRPDQAVVLDHEDPTWPVVAGVLLELDRRGERGCVVDASWSVLMTPEKICRPGEVADGWVLDVRPSGTPETAGAVDVAETPRVEVTSR